MREIYNYVKNTEYKSQINETTITINKLTWELDSVRQQSIQVKLVLSDVGCTGDKDKMHYSKAFLSC